MRFMYRNQTVIVGDVGGFRKRNIDKQLDLETFLLFDEEPQFEAQISFQLDGTARDWSHHDTTP